MRVQFRRAIYFFRTHQGNFLGRPNWLWTPREVAPPLRFPAASCIVIPSASRGQNYRPGPGFDEWIIWRGGTQWGSRTLALFSSRYCWNLQNRSSPILHFFFFYFRSPIDVFMITPRNASVRKSETIIGKQKRCTFWTKCSIKSRPGRKSERAWKCQ